MFFNAMNINQLKGRIVNDPEVKETKTGKKLLTFNLMFFTRQTTDAEGSHTNFIQVEAWQKVAEMYAPYMCRGLEILVNGSIVQKRWSDENGNLKSQFYFTADAINITDLKFSTDQEIQEIAA
ncbi:MAG: single-stranded DNA-binding protein [Spirochaetia bacterium]|nr:single-stranded DNA-binding protein [Spirochaetia bacterium]